MTVLIGFSLLRVLAAWREHVIESDLWYPGPAQEEKPPQADPR